MSMIQSVFTVRLLSRGSLAFLLGSLVALSASRVAAQPRMPTHVACVGDSITAGFAASSASKAYPSVLQTLFGSSVQVRNFGHSGATLMSVADQPYQNQPEYTNATTFVSGAGATAILDVIIMLGTNDSKANNWMVGTGTRAQQFVTDLTAMVDHFASLATHPVIYLALPSRSFANTYGISGAIIHDQMLPLIRQVAAAKGVPIIDVDTPTASHPELFPDGVHPSDTGYALVAQVMHDGLLRVPQVTLTRPTAGAVLAGPAVAMAADASGATVAITGVEFFHATAAAPPISVARVTAAPFATTWSSATPGTYQLTAKATDSTGAAATSAPVTVTVTAGSDAGSDAGSTGQGGASGAGGTGAGGSTLADAGRDATGAGGSTLADAGRDATGAGGSAGAADAGRDATGAGGSAGAGADAAGDAPAGVDAGATTSSGSGCSCRLPAGERGESGGVGLLLAAIVFFRRRARARG